VAVKSQQIVAQLKKLLDQTRPKTIHCFEPIASLHEVDVAPLIVGLQREHPLTTIHTSRRHGEVWQVVTFDKWPITDKVLYDCIIVPTLGFDARLHRLGYGGGYYDRLLSDQPQALKLGACFELGHADELPNEPHDIALDVVATEVQVYRKLGGRYS
jgi:5,10-methenyltetrahydrofolate synthetase